MNSKQLLAETMKELMVDELQEISGGNSLSNLFQHIISAPATAATGSMGNCVTMAANFFSPPPPPPTMTGFGCGRH